MGGTQSRAGGRDFLHCAQHGGDKPFGRGESIVLAPIVFVVDDDDTVRRALVRLIGSAGYRVADFPSAARFLEHPYATDDPSCLVLDVQMPDLGGLDLQRALNEASTSLPIIFLTGHDDCPTIVKAMKAGAVDFLAKPVESDDLLHAVATALRDATQALERRTSRELFRRRLARLTLREREVMVLLVNGCLNKQAAYELGIAEKTVKVHRARVMKKMEAKSLVELARAADKAGVSLFLA
ncbi:response regulator transcription factor [Achromobacter aloeverae]|uniref:DNA-binding response regulator n=1 Tax=Achromobacter aloeverae TaxID=1750518 RepID=A0A4Q1HEG4_9BURK|nr:response regulator [Achromobacter aloeverae]RXN84718.1 DNA-binding response regulator [Achromobacter aloeverae]